MGLGLGRGDVPGQPHALGRPGRASQRARRRRASCPRPSRRRRRGRSSSTRREGEASHEEQVEDEGVGPRDRVLRSIGPAQGEGEGEGEGLGKGRVRWVRVRVRVRVRGGTLSRHERVRVPELAVGPIVKTIITQADLCHMAQRSMQCLLIWWTGTQRAAGEPRNEPPRKQRNRMTPCVTLAEAARSATIVGRTVFPLIARCDVMTLLLIERQRRDLQEQVEERATADGVWTVHTGPLGHRHSPHPRTLTRHRLNDRTRHAHTRSLHSRSVLDDTRNARCAPRAAHAHALAVRGASHTRPVLTPRPHARPMHAHASLHGCTLRRRHVAARRHVRARRWHVRARWRHVRTRWRAPARWRGGHGGRQRAALVAHRAGAGRPPAPPDRSRRRACSGGRRPRAARHQTAAPCSARRARPPRRPPCRRRTPCR